MAAVATAIRPKDVNEDSVLGFFVHLMNGDLDAFAAIWADDAVQENPWRFDGLTAALVGRDEILDDYRRMFRGRQDMVFTIKSLHRTVDPDCIIVECNGRSIVKETGKIYDQNYIAIFRLRDGKIVLNRFYFDPIVARNAFKGVLIGEGISKQDG